MRYLFISLLTLVTIAATAQKKVGTKKYNSLLWEITGNGIKKPAYLFGTMHVSSKLAFNLSDTFYNKLKSVDAVALETDPTTWQDDFQHSMYTHMSDISDLEYSSLPEDYITKSTFQFSPYDKPLKAALANDPYIINSFLYRNFNGLADFEEATYLDMHIYQCGRKLYKPIYGLENFDESEKIMISAYRAQAAETKRKSHSKEVEDENNSSHMSNAEKIEDAYRKGDLDLMDSLDKRNETSEAFNDLFLYKRNEIQAFHMDSLLKTGISIFAGVGAAHLPGERGVIELLRQAGYTLTPVIMGMQSPKQKDEINKVRIPVTFYRQVAEDSMYTVLVPGKLYSFSFSSSLNGRQWIHADFGNGSYYTITRLSTGGGLWGNDEAYINRKIDSILYENIPGKILERSTIKVNGINGFNIVNKTSKSNIQRYNIFVRGSEVIIFKMSGNEDYVQGAEAEKFFGSITLKPRKKTWKEFKPENNAFSVSFPDDPIPGDANADNDGSGYSAKIFSTIPLSYECTDTANGNFYYLFYKSITNHEVLEEDTFNLALASESFITSGFINEPTYRKQLILKGYPYLETKGTTAEGTKYISRIFLKGTNYYTLIAKYNKAESEAKKFIESFYFTPFSYEAPKTYTDSAMYFSVKSPVIPDSVSKAFLDISRLAKKTQDMDRRTKNYEEPYWKENMKVLFKSKTTNEIIAVSSRPYPKYYYINDSAEFWKTAIEAIKVYDSKSKSYDLVEKKRTFTYLTDRRICDVVLGDTGSSQIIKARWIIYNGRVFLLKVLTDSATTYSAFIDQFYNSFTPLFDSSTNFDLFKPKSDVFFKDFYCKDSTVSKFARKNMNYVKFVEADIPDILKAIKSLESDNKQKDYLNYKVSLIKEMGYLKKDSLVANKIKSIYDAATDTATIQNEAVIALARLKQQQSYSILKNIMSTEPPVFDNSKDLDKLFDLITDSAKLAKTLLPDILTLNSLDDYKKKINFLLTDLIDSNQITTKDYENIFYKIFFDAKIEQKKLMAADEKLINKTDDDDRVEHYKSPNTLKQYCKLLIPFWDKNPAVPAYFIKLLKTRDNSVKLNTVELLLKYKKPVEDTVLLDICKEEKYQSELYDVLKRDSATNRFPAKYKKQELIAKSLLLNTTSTYNKKDSVEYLNKSLMAVYKGIKGYVHFFKYKSNEKDADWMLAVAGIQPADLKDINADETIVEFTDKILKTNQPIDIQLNKLLKEQLYSLRKSSSKYFGNGYYRRRFEY